MTTEDAVCLIVLFFAVAIPIASIAICVMSDESWDRLRRTITGSAARERQRKEFYAVHRRLSAIQRQLNEIHDRIRDND